MKLLSFTLLALLSTFASAHRPRPNILKRRNPTYSPLAEPSLFNLTSLTDLSIIDFHEPTSALSRLLVPRTAGSQNLTDLQNMVTAHFTRLKWTVEKDTFDAMTPYGVKTFTNLIFKHDPEANRRLVLSAHLDSKFFPTHPEDQFVGATDSAAPCAMMLDVAEGLTGWLDARRDRILEEGGEEGRETQGETLQIVFFDGEEAFKMWTGEDSIYGAKCVLFFPFSVPSQLADSPRRHLASLWSKPTIPPTASRPIPPTPISRISHLVLLDLLGATNPTIRSFYPATGWFFDEFLHAETRLGEAGFLWDGVADAQAYSAAKGKVGAKERSFFAPRGAMNGYGGGIEDDHIPFLKLGVPIVHMITVPFPRVWHTINASRFAGSWKTSRADV